MKTFNELFQPIPFEVRGKLERVLLDELLSIEENSPNCQEKCANIKAVFKLIREFKAVP